MTKATSAPDPEPEPAPEPEVTEEDRAEKARLRQ